MSLDAALGADVSWVPGRRDVETFKNRDELFPLAGEMSAASWTVIHRKNEFGLTMTRGVARLAAHDFPSLPAGVGAIILGREKKRGPPVTTPRQGLLQPTNEDSLAGPVRAARQPNSPHLMRM